MIKNKILRNLFIFIVLAASITGCSKEDEALSLLHRSAENFLQADSVMTDIEVDTLFETVSETTETKMYFALENTTDPLSGHAIGYSFFERGGLISGGEVEIYQVLEDDENVTYSRVNDKWIKETENDDDKGSEFKSEFLDPDDKPDKFTLKEESVNINGLESYELVGHMSGKDIMNIFDVRAVNELSGIEDIDMKELGRSKIPVLIYIYKDSELPAKIYVDMTDVLDNIYKEMDENTTVSNFTISIEYDNYNSIEPILVPEEVKKEIDE